jgi:hypothetical protein
MQDAATIAVRITTAFLGLLITLCGAFYVFYSKAAARLADVEQEVINRKRVRLRRFGGGAMMALGASLVAGFNAVRVDVHPDVFAAIWIGVCILLALLLFLAIFDLRLTLRLHRARIALNRRMHEER